MGEFLIKPLIGFVWAVLHGHQTRNLSNHILHGCKTMIDLLWADFWFELEYSEVSGHSSHKLNLITLRGKRLFPHYDAYFPQSETTTFG
jgi:hypothetical protein